MKETLNADQNEKSLSSKLTQSDLNKGDTNRVFYQYENDSSKVIRSDTFEDLTERYENMANPIKVVELGKKLFSEIQADYNIKVPAEIVLDKDDKNKEVIYIITDKIEGISLEESLNEATPEFSIKLEDLYVSISKYYLDKLHSQEAHLADLNNMSQYMYGTKKGEKEKEIYLVDTDLYMNKGDAYLLHNVKWLIRHMPKRYDEAINNIRKIIEIPLSPNLSDSDKKLAEKEIEESLRLLNGTYKREEGREEEGFIPSPLD